jgi:hypothetical protein
MIAVYLSTAREVKELPVKRRLNPAAATSRFRFAGVCAFKTRVAAAFAAGGRDNEPPDRRTN